MSMGRKDKKPQQLHWLDPQALLSLSEVAAHGADKYGDGYNYRLGYDWSLSYDAGQRHLMKFWDGEDVDKDSGLPHLAHAAWHCLTLLSDYLRRAGTDDRFKGAPRDGEPKADVIDMSKWLAEHGLRPTVSSIASNPLCGRDCE